ncbi:putative CBL-interacting protein kinase 13 [Hordeum vulgare]|nr:putative CBL-interacting protein kinase 13 [Hordeum vulgare]
MSLARVWDMYEDENKFRLRQNVVNAEENLKVLEEKDKMEKDLRFFKVDFAKMVADKEHALDQLGNTVISFSDLKEELQKKSISENISTNIHQVVRAKEKKDRKLMKQELEPMKREREKQ